jgi:NADH-quinone oxidoreductase subunit F
VRRPGNYELPLGVTFRELIFEHGGGVPSGKGLKGILTAGASAPILPATPEVLDTPLTYEDVEKVGSSLGSASVICLDEDTDMTWAALKMVRFFKHESCGKCTPCREGCYWMLQILERIEQGGAVPEDIDLLEDVAGQIEGKCLCALGEFALNPARATIRHFREDYEARVNGAAPEAK